MRLYVVTSGPPGPGVKGLIDEVERDLTAAGESQTLEEPEGAYDAGVARALRELRAKLRENPPCEFVEVEDEEGRSVGLGVTGRDWLRRERDGLWALGPFLPADRAVPTAERTWTLGESGGLRVYADGPEVVLEAGPMFVVHTRSDEEFEALLEALGGVDAASIGSACAIVSEDDALDGLRVLLYAPPAPPRPEHAALVRLREAKQRRAEGRAERSNEEE